MNETNYRSAESVNLGDMEGTTTKLPEYPHTPQSEIPYEQRCKEIISNKFAIPWHPNFSGPPFPKMHFNSSNCHWMPDDVEEFERLHGDGFQEMLQRVQDYIHNPPKAQKRKPKKQVQQSTTEPIASNYLAESTESAVQQSTTTPVTPAKADNTSESAVQQVEQSNGTPSTPKKQAKPAAKLKAKKAKEEVEKPDVQEFNCNIIADVPSVATSESNSETSDTEVPMATVEQSKCTRVSQKMIDTDFDTLAKKYLQVTSLAEKKPVFLPKAVRDTLVILARLSGDPRLSASHIVINIIRAFIDEHRDIINRKLGSVKLSI